jgi:hypothetical protein
VDRQRSETHDRSDDQVDQVAIHHVKFWCPLRTKLAHETKDTTMRCVPNDPKVQKIRREQARDTRFNDKKATRKEQHSGCLITPTIPEQRIEEDVEIENNYTCPVP